MAEQIKLTEIPEYDSLSDFPPAEAAASMRAMMEDQEREMAHIDGIIQELKTRIDELQAQKSSIQRSYNANKAIVAPVRRLPPETIGDIFIHCLPLHAEIHGDEAPLLLMRVCRRWLRVAVGTPHLWNNLNLVGRKFKWDPDYAIQTWLSNSGTLPIDITLNRAAWSYKFDGRNAVNLLVKNFHRFRKFSAELDKLLGDEIASQSRPVHAPLLDHVELCWESCGDIPISHLEDYIQAPQLSSFSFDCPSMGNIFLFHSPSIRSVRLSYNWFPQLRTSLDFLCSYSNLSSLDIEISGALQPPAVDGHSRTLLLPSVEKFTLKFDSENDPRPFLNAFEIPMLREFSLVLRHKYDLYRPFFPSVITAMDSFLGQNPLLQQLSLGGCWSSDVERLVTVLSRLKGLGSLSLELDGRMLPDSLFEALTPDSSSLPNSWICPNLSFLGIADKFHDSADLLIKLVERRAPPNPDVTTSGTGYLQCVRVGPRHVEGERLFRTLDEISQRCGGLFKVEIDPPR